MSKSRNLEESRQRALAALQEYPEWDLIDIARHIGINRAHLYRLAVRFPDVRKAYKFVLALKYMMAEDTVSDVALGSRRCDIRSLNVIIHRGMKNRYYLSRWEAREAAEPVFVIQTVTEPRNN